MDLQQLADLASKAYSNTYDRNKYIRDLLEPMRKDIEANSAGCTSPVIENSADYIYSACNGVALLNAASKEENDTLRAMMLDQCLYLGDQ